MIRVQKQKLRYEGEMSLVYHLPMYEKVDIMQMILDAYNAGEKEITIPRGAYRIWPKEGIRGHLRFDHMEDFTVNAYGCVFLYQDVNHPGVYGTYSSNITLRGFASDYEDTIFTQMKCIAINREENYYDFEVDEGYAMYDEEDLKDPYGIAGCLYREKDGKLCIGGGRYDFSMKRLELLGGRKIRFHVGIPNTNWDFKVGDYFCPMNSFARRNCNNTCISASGPFHFEDCTFWSSTISCIAECYSEGGSTYRNLKIMPGPKPLGATHRRLHSMSGDAFHLTADRKGPLIENVYFEGIQDDGINIHGLYNCIDTVLDPKHIILATKGSIDIRDGDTLRVYGEELDMLQMVKVAKATDITKTYNPEDKLFYQAPYSKFIPNQYYDITLEEEIAGKRGDWVVDADCIGAGMVVRGCTFYNIRPRGVLIKSSNALVENCVFDHVASAGVRIIPEHEWMECDYSQNVIVRNCYIRHCGFNNGFSGHGITVDGHEAIEHRNIVIEDNVFEDNYGEDIHAACVQGLTIRNNTFSKRHDIALAMQTDGKTDLVPTVYINKCKDVTIENNTYPENRVFGVVGYDTENVKTDKPYGDGSWASDCIPGAQGRGGWHWQCAPIGSNDYRDYPNWIAGHGADNGWWTGEFGDRTNGCILRSWWDTYICAGTESDAVRTFVCPKDGTLVVSCSEPVKAGDIFDETDGIRVKVTKNDEQVWPAEGEWKEVPLFNTADRFWQKVEVKKGDAIHFRVNKNTTDNGNGTSWNPFVYYLQ